MGRFYAAKASPTGGISLKPPERQTFNNTLRKARAIRFGLRRAYPMISAWWTVFAFFGGGCAGVLLFALMRVAADAVPRSVCGHSAHDGCQVNASEPSLNHTSPRADISK